jgi:hypothetical protein
MAIWTEWDKIKDIIVGDCPDKSNLNNYHIDKIFSETKEDLQKLADFLKQDTNVYRPTILDTHDQTAPIVPRDQHFVYNKTIASTFTSMPKRSFDHWHYYDIFVKFFKHDYNWISQPMPFLTGLPEDKEWWEQGGEVYRQKNGFQLLSHTATMFKCGSDIIINHQGPGTDLGYKWLENNIPANFIKNTGTPCNGWGHIDQYWFMTDDDTVVAYNKKWVPNCLKSKKIIEIQDTVTPVPMEMYAKEISISGRYSPAWLDKYFAEWKGYVQECCFDTNVLVLAPNKVLLSNPQYKLQKLLEKNGIETYSVNLRHSLFWEGGVHCCTLDIARSGDKRKII